MASLVVDGIVPGMRSVRLLHDAWGKSQKYHDAILGECRWIEDERVIIDRLLKAKGLRLQEALVLIRNSKMIGMRLGFREAFALMKKLQ